MRTFSQVQNDVRTWIKEVSGDSGYWTNQEIKDAINETYHFIADQTMCFKLEEIIQVKANIRKYKLPENYVVGSLYRVEFNDKRIFPITSGELDALSSTWRSTTSETPTHFIPPGDICNTDEIILYPCPSVDGKEYNLASDSKDDGVIVSVGDDSFEEFESDEGVLVATSGEAHFDETEGTGPVLDIKDSENNVRIFGAKYPKRLFNDNEVFLHPLSNNPRSILTNGSLAILLSKEGDGKDIAKSSYFNKRFMESMPMFQRSKLKRIHRMRSITELSLHESGNYGLNLGEHYPTYVR